VEATRPFGLPGTAVFSPPSAVRVTHLSESLKPEYPPSIQESFPPSLSPSVRPTRRSYIPLVHWILIEAIFPPKGHVLVISPPLFLPILTALELGLFSVPNDELGQAVSSGGICSHPINKCDSAVFFRLSRFSAPFKGQASPSSACLSCCIHGRFLAPGVR